MLMALQGDGPVLVVPPKTLLAQWQDEMWSLLRLPSARWTPQGWIDEHGHLHPARGPESVARCPRRVGLVSQGLITSRSPVVEHLLSMRYECVVVDEAHRARRRNLAPNRQHERPDPNNLMKFVYEVGARTKSLLLATATPVQLLPVEAFDLLSMLATGHEGVLGNMFSRWRQVEEALALTLGRTEVPSDSTGLWEYVRNPLPPSSEGKAFGDVRRTLDMKSDAWVAMPEAYASLRKPEQQALRQLAGEYGRMHNPFLRHIVRRTREYLESTIDPETHEPYLRPVRVELLGEDDASALTLPLYLQEAYATAEEFCRTLGGRVKGAGFLKTLLLRRVGSSIRAGEITAQKMLDSWESVVEDSDEDDDEPDLAVEPETAARGRGAPDGGS
ncbi:MAG: helicase SNF2, partial [Proteobacteria bacterium]|nr:helicase SNF2 [Pseudomonadota bacterium]